MRKHIRIYLLNLVVICLLAACEQGQHSGAPFVISGPTMGTAYTIKINELEDRYNGQKIRKDINDILERINNSMSTYIDSSELSKINQSPQTEWIRVSDDLLTVIEQALAVSKLTGGAFDITVGPIVNLWGFGPGPRRDDIPNDDQINLVLQNVGYQLLQTRQEPPSIKKSRTDLYIDLSGIAKGYAVDKLAEYLEGIGINNYLVEIGGELRAKGNNPEGALWRIGIEKPVTGGRFLQRVIELDNKSMATSGDYRNYIENEGVRYSHTFDPNTGKPISHKLASVTVIGSTSMFADALATGLMVLGQDKAREIAERENMAVLLIVKTDDGFTEIPSRAFGYHMME
ncbi:MAG: FAD:protein FMN transferase [Gammaproteobacteria bacterium]